MTTFATTRYISTSSGNDIFSGTSPADAWTTVKFATGGDSILFLRGDIFYGPTIKKISTTSIGNRIYYGAYGDSHLPKPAIIGYSIIKNTGWTNVSSNIWSTVLNSTNATGMLPGYANCGFIKVDGIIHGVRRGTSSGLSGQWQFYCDIASKTVYVYSTSNPSLIASDIQISNGNMGGGNITDKLVNLPNYATIEDIKIIGCADAAINIANPQYDTIRRCEAIESGGEMKGQTDTVRQGEGFVFNNGGTNSYMGYNYVKQTFEGALTFQAHSGNGTTYFINCVAEYNTTDSNQCSFNATIMDISSGFTGCKVRNNTFQDDGYSWSFPPNGKPKDNQAITILSNGWLCDASHSDIIFENNAYSCPREGVFYFGSISGPITDPRFISRNNQVFIDPAVFIRKNFNGATTPYTYKLATHVTFTTDQGYESGSIWDTCGTVIVIGDSTHEQIYYRDADGDKYGNSMVFISSPVPVAGYVLDNTDCDDSDANIHPNAVEILDGKDNNCDGFIDNCIIRRT